jgi:hypothetical protein
MDQADGPLQVDGPTVGEARRSMAMAAVRTRYELRVGALVSKAALASFRIPLTPIAVPRNTVYRLRVPADRDLSDVLRRLIERDVQVVEIRRCPEPRRRDRRPAQVPAEPPEEQVPDPVGGVVIPFPAGAGPGPSGADPASGRPWSARRRTRRRGDPSTG